MRGEKLLMAMQAVDPALAEDARSSARRHAPRRLTAALLAAALVLALGVGAAAYYSDFFLDYFAGQKGGELSESQQAAIGALTAVIGQSQTVDGWTITVDRALATRHNAYIKLDVTAPAEVDASAARFDFKNLRNEDFFFPDETSTAGVGGYGTSMEKIETADQPKNEATFLLELHVNATADSEVDLADGQERTLTLRDLYLAGEKGEGDVLAAEGEWSFTFTLPKAEEIELLDGTVSVLAKNPVTGNKEDVGISSFRLTALGASCEYITAYDYIQPFDDVTVTMTDGAKVTGREKENSARGSEKVCSFVFDTPIDLNAVDHVIFQGLELVMP